MRKRLFYILHSSFYILLVGHSAGNEATMPAAVAAGHSETVGRNSGGRAVGIVAASGRQDRVAAAIRADRHRLQVRLIGGRDRSGKGGIVGGHGLDTSGLDSVGDGLHVGAAGLLL